MAYLADGLLVGDGVGGRGVLVAGLESVADERWADSLDHEVVVMESGNDGSGVNTVERSGDLGSRHFYRLFVGWKVGRGLKKLAGSNSEGSS